MTDPALLHTSVLCFVVLSCSDLASSSSRQSLTSLTASPPASEWLRLWSFWTHKDVKDPNSLKTRHGFTGCLVSFRHVFVYSGFCCCQRLNKYLPWRRHRVKLSGLYRCQRLNYINTMLPLALTCTNLWMWKYFAVFLTWECTLCASFYNKSQAKMPQMCYEPWSPTGLQIFTTLGCQRDSCLCFTCCLAQKPLIFKAC